MIELETLVPVCIPDAEETREQKIILDLMHAINLPPILDINHGMHEISDNFRVDSVPWR